MVFSGTAVSRGHARAVVTATGMRTEVGRIAALLKQTPDDVTPLQRELDRTGRGLGSVVIAIAVVMIATLILVEDVRGFSALIDVLILGVALAVAAVPEGLPAVVTAVLALGVRRMAQRQAIVRHLAAVETLGSATVIASDKTGTLTRNEMTVRAVVTAGGRVAFDGGGYAPDGAVSDDEGQPVLGPLRSELFDALRVADRANNAVVTERGGRWIVLGDPTEGALRVAAMKAGIESEAIGAQLPRVGELPFTSERQMMTTLHLDLERPGLGHIFTKGAPETVLARCTRELSGADPRPLSPARRAEILAANDALASQALRTLGLARRSVTADLVASFAAHPPSRLEEDLVFVGLVGMLDPPRDEAREAVGRARAAGVRPLMITGDHPRTAAVIAQELGISHDGRVVTGGQFADLSPDAQLETVRDVAVYARVNPEHKLQIVDALQRTGAVVAMTGDGVNDAPALKKADIGVAMGIAGTDVAKEAADVVLLDDNFATIVAAVEEGRVIFANIRKFLRYLLSSNCGEVFTMFFGVLLAGSIGLPTQEGAVVLPLLATQILWINLVTDGPPALALGVEAADSGVMRRAPRPVHEGVLTPAMWWDIVFVGIVMAAGTLLALDLGLPGGVIDGSGDLRYAQTLAFTTLMLFQIVNIFNARSDRTSAFTAMFTNRWLFAAIALSVSLQVSVVHVSFLQEAFGTVDLAIGEWLLCLAIASSVLWAKEIAKWFERRLARTI